MEVWGGVLRRILVSTIATEVAKNTSSPSPQSIIIPLLLYVEYLD